jgi:hypothetical protein
VIDAVCAKSALAAIQPPDDPMGRKRIPRNSAFDSLLYGTAVRLESLGISQCSIAATITTYACVHLERNVQLSHASKFY